MRAKANAAAPLGETPSPPPHPPALAGPYPLELPRILHRAGAEQRVETPDACEAALAEGWLLRPITLST